MNAAKFDYSILSHRALRQPAALDLYNQAYRFWAQFWRDFWAKSGAEIPSDSFLAEIYYRQTNLHCLTVQGQMAGMVMQTAYDLSLAVTRDLPYFSLYPATLIAHLKERGVEKLVTHEFLTVDPRWRKSQIGFSLGPLLMSCGARRMRELGGQASAAIARKDIGIAQLCCNLGWERVQSDVTYKGYPCDVICLEAGREVVPADIAEAVEGIWSRRQDYSSVDIQSNRFVCFEESREAA